MLPKAVCRRVVDFDLLDRARVILDVRRSDAVRFLTPTRIVVPLHGGAAIVSEQFDAGPLAKLYGYTIPSAMEGLLNLCASVGTSTRALEFGSVAREAFACETSMAANLNRVMDSIGFAEMAGTT